MLTDVTYRALVECGVAQGGSSAVMAVALSDLNSSRHLSMFDSFEGLPEPSSEDLDDESGSTDVHIRPLPKGSCLGNFEDVEHLMTRQFKIPAERFTMIKGWFQETVSAQRDGIGPISLLRLDGDWHESTKCCLEALYGQVSAGGIVVIDDYYSCFGSKKATDEFFAGLRIPRSALRTDGSGGVIYRKDPV